MKIISWNIRGLGRREKRRGIRRLLSQRKVDILFLQETKKDSINPNMVNSFWPSTNFDFASVNASGLAGGILCAWDLDVFSLDEVIQNKHFILLKGKIVPEFECILINVYTPNDPRDRKILWDEISNLRSRFTLPWCVSGDFNEVCKISERKNCLRISQGIRQFNDFISNLELCNLPLLGRNFT